MAVESSGWGLLPSLTLSVHLQDTGQEALFTHDGLLSFNWWILQTHHYIPCNVALYYILFLPVEVELIVKYLNGIKISCLENLHDETMRSANL